MSTITHAMIGGLIGLCLYTLTQKSDRQFKAEHVIIFALNCFVGPDFSKFLSPFCCTNYWTNPLLLTINGFVHSIIGWVIISVLLAGIYYMIFSLAATRTQGKKIPITYGHVLMLIIAGGFNHFGIDLLDATIRVLPNGWSNQIYLSLTTFTLLGENAAEGLLWPWFGWFDDKYLLLLGLGFMVLLIWLLKNKSLKSVWYVGLGFFVFIYSLIILIGGNIVENENDLGMILYVGFAWFSPVALCFLSMETHKPN